MKRILTAIVLIAVVVALLYFGPQLSIWTIPIAAAVVAALAAMEYRDLAHKTGVHIPAWWLLAATALIFYFTEKHVDFELPVLSLLAFVLLGWSGFRAPIDRVLPDAALGLFSLIYIVYPLTLINLIREHDDGFGFVIFLCVCVWMGDIAALYIGKNFGRHKLSSLSPNKTWEGSIASVVGSVAFGVGLYFAGTWMTTRGNTYLHLDMQWWEVVLLATLLNLAAQLGDLLESAIKRGAGVKDSGTILPGHGGILDRIDALLLATPVLWYVLLLRDWYGIFR